MNALLLCWRYIIFLRLKQPLEKTTKKKECECLNVPATCSYITHIPLEFDAIRLHTLINRDTRCDFITLKNPIGDTTLAAREISFK